MSFATTSAIAAFASQAVAGRTQPVTRARSLYEALGRLLTARTIIADKDNTPKSREPLTAEALWAAAQRGEKPLAGCYELTVLYVAMARSIGLDARGAETNVRGSGAIGHLVAIVVASGGQIQVDLQNRNFGKGPMTHALSDGELAAHHYNHRAVAAFLRHDFDAAQTALSDGMSIASTVPQLWSNRAALAASRARLLDADASRAAFAVAIADARQAVALAPDIAVYRYQLGAVRIASGALCSGLESLGDALRRDPEYGEAKALVRSTLETHPQLSCATAEPAP